MCNMLEVFLYNRTACESADDVLVELIDYCYRKLARLVAKCDRLGDGEYLFPSESLDAKGAINRNLTKEQELDKQFNEIEFHCAMICLSLIRFITDHMENLPVPIVH